MKKTKSKTMVAYRGHGAVAQQLFERAVPVGRQCGVSEAHVVVYECPNEASCGRAERPGALHVVVAATYPMDLSPGLFWIKPDRGAAFTSMIRMLNPGCD